MALPGAGGIATRNIALLVTRGVKGQALTVMMDALGEAGAVVRLLSARLGSVTTEEGARFEVDATLENSPSVLFAAVVLPGGVAAVETLAQHGQALEFLKDQYRHCKTILALGDSRTRLENLGLSLDQLVGHPELGVLVVADDELDPDTFISAVAKHRHRARDSDPPRI